MLRNSFIKLRLSKTWLITFVVAVLSVTQQIDKHVCVVTLSPFHGQLHDINDCFNIISVYMEDRTLGGFGNIGTIDRCSSIDVVCSKTNLIVGNNVYGSSCLVSI